MLGEKKRYARLNASGSLTLSKSSKADSKPVADIVLQGSEVAYEEDLMMITDAEGKDWEFTMMEGEESEAAVWNAAVQKNIDFFGK